MVGNRCAVCDQRVRIAGGLENLWTFEGEPGEGVILEFADGSSALVCFSCLEDLPEMPSPDDLEALAAERSGEGE